MLLVFVVAQSVATQAADLSGAWASDSTVCGKVFTKEDNKLAFRPDADLYAGGVIIQGKQLIGRFQKCGFKTLHDDGSSMQVKASCSDGVAVSDVTFDLKISGENQIVLSSKAPVPMEMPFVRCSL